MSEEHFFLWCVVYCRSARCFVTMMVCSVVILVICPVMLSGDHTYETY